MRSANALHVVDARSVIHPAPSTCRPSLMLTQNDVTKRTQLEMAMAQLAESQLGMLGQVRDAWVWEGCWVRYETQGSGGMLGPVSGAGIREGALRCNATFCWFLKRF